MLVIIDPGHGGLNEKGEYVTTGKRSRHPVDGEMWYEGHEMRKYAKHWAKVLRNLGYDVAFTVHPDNYKDTPLAERVALANSICKDPKNCVLLSLHTNADSDKSPRPGQAHGKEVYTSPGVTLSDYLAKFYIEEFKKSSYGDFRLRKDMSDGFPDKEANFFMVRRTSMPAILIEFGFHTNDDDVRVMRDWSYCHFTVIAMYKALKRYQKFLKESGGKI